VSQGWALQSCALLISGTVAIEPAFDVAHAAEPRPRSVEAAQSAAVNDPLGLGDGGQGGELPFRAWLEAVVAGHQAIGAAVERASAAAARAEGARGVFDLEVVARGQLQPVGKYLEPQVAVGLEQATPLWGLRMRGGWRTGADYPDYKGGEITGTGGEAFVDATLPLWRDRDIDARRARIRSADVRRDAEALRARARRLEVAQSAGLAWWSRALRAAEVCVAERLVGLAEARARQVSGRVAAGERPRIEATDVQRLVLGRQARLAAATARLAAAEAELAMHGVPAAAPTGCAVGGLATSASAYDLPELKAEARQHRPDLLLYAVQEAGLEVELARALNLGVPKADARLWARGDLGEPRPIGPDALSVMKAEVGVALDFALPLQRREAQGEAAAVSAELRALEAERAWAEAQVDATLAGLVAEREAASARAELTRGAYGAAAELERAEGRAFELGQSTLVILNLREEATAEAALAVAEARVAAAVASLRLEAVAGRLVGGRGEAAR
jgi:cobalt-zinc-cadmium efflux system outer membrane protein